MHEPVTPILSKSQQLASILTESIESGAFAAGERVPSENELSQRYAISRATVREAIAALVQSGMLTRTQGKGTFVNGDARRNRAGATVALFTKAHEHVYEAQTRAVVRGLQRHGIMPLVIDAGDMGNDKAAVDAAIENALLHDVAGVVMDADLTAALDRVCRSRGFARPPVAVLDMPPSAAVPPATVYVSPDFEAGTRLGTEHLIRLGHKDILFLAHSHQAIGRGKSPEDVQGVYGSVVRGYVRALETAGLRTRQQFFLIEGEFQRDAAALGRLRELLSSSRRPSAVFAFGDYRAKRVIDTALELGLSVPDELAVIGFWNTPWTDLIQVPLTSVSIREEEIGRVAAERLSEAARDGSTLRAETVWVRPELVVRESCGSREASALSLK